MDEHTQDAVETIEPLTEERSMLSWLYARFGDMQKECGRIEDTLSSRTPRNARDFKVMAEVWGTAQDMIGEVLYPDRTKDITIAVSTPTLIKRLLEAIATENGYSDSELKRVETHSAQE